MIVDWLDTDIDPGFPDGAEDSVYTSLTPAYRPPNMRITRTSELLALHDFGIERYRKLEPFIAALPPGTSINLCTAPAEVLDAQVRRHAPVHAGSRESAGDAQATLLSEPAGFSRQPERRPAARTGRRENSSAKAVPTSAPTSGSLLALPSSTCTVFCIAPTGPISSVPF